ncbi:hypothetical protein [Brevibacterium oceani]|uniref:hypothetical protein n=1 Tax=Brevibacterium oceani TaxID=358099 RepID=UPI0015E7942D|nr:hypothetical protein [Brevibacterium oceani]
MTSTDEKSPFDPQSTIDALRGLCRTAEFRVPGKHETWDSYHEGRSSFANEVEQILDRRKTQAAAIADVSAALNRAADEVLEIAHDGDDERLRDAVNLVVNAGLHFVEHPESSLIDAVTANYGDPVDDVLENLR